MPDVSLPITLIDGDQYRWDVRLDGSISEGTDDAYDGGLDLRNFPEFKTAQSENGGREIVLGAASINGLDVQRKIYVPEDQAWARYLEVFTNPTDATITYTARVDTNLGSNGSTRPIGTSSGDKGFNKNDNWIVTDDRSDGGGDPTMLHVVAGQNGDVRPSNAYRSGDFIRVEYDLTLQPGETQIVMHFAAQNPDRRTALDKANTLANLESGATEGLTNAERAQIVSFDVATIIEGSSEADSLIGDEGRNNIFGFAGNDTLEGRGGDDSLDGGDGSDLIDGGAGRDTIRGGGGADTLTGGADADSFLFTVLETTDGVVRDVVTDYDASEGDVITLEPGVAITESTLSGSGNLILTLTGGDQVGLLGVADLAQVVVTREASKQNDSILGTIGNDRIGGLGGNDTIDGLQGDDTLTGDAGRDLLSGDGGNDSIQAGDNGDTVFGGAGNDTIDGGSGDDDLGGGAGNDAVKGEDGSDIVTGGAGDDRIDGGQGEDTLGGGEGDDVLRGGLGSDRDFLDGGSGDDKLNGEGGADVLGGGGGGDTIDGNGGDDYIQGGAGNDIMTGAEGRNEFSFMAREAADGIQDLDIITDYDAADGDALFLSAGVIVEESVVDAEKGNLTLTLTGGDKVRLDGITDFADVTVFVGETNFADSIVGSTGGDTLAGLDGNDTIRSGGGDDLLDGDAGSDLVRSEAGNDTIDGGGQNDTLLGGDGDDIIFGGVFPQSGLDVAETESNNTFAERNVFSASASGVTTFEVTGELDSAGGDVDYFSFEGLIPGLSYVAEVVSSPVDPILGLFDESGTLIDVDDDDGSGVLSSLSFSVRESGQINLAISGYNDSNFVGDHPETGTYSVRLFVPGPTGVSDRDTISGEGGNDFLYGGGSSDAIWGGPGNDTVDGGYSADTVNGGDGNDAIDAGRGDDIVYGGTGSDSIDGNIGSDVIHGGADPVVVWSENFNDLSDGALEDTGVTAWSTDGSAALWLSSDNGVSDSAFRFAGTVNQPDRNDSVLLWSSEAIDIAGLTGVEVDFDLKGSGSLDAGGSWGDFFRLYATVDGGARAELFAQDGTLSVGEDMYQSFNVAGVPSGSALTIEVEAKTNGANGERYLFDNLTVTANDPDVGNAPPVAWDDAAAADKNKALVEGNTLAGNGVPGNDTIRGGPGNDSIWGGEADDSIDGGEDRDMVSGGRGRDIIHGNQGSDKLHGDWDDDTIHGDDGNDLVTGGSGNDSITGGTGNDTIDGGLGGDTVLGGTGRDSMDGGDGFDVLEGEGGNDTIAAGAGADRVDGGNNDDSIAGDEGNDTILGGDGNDSISGGDGDDRVDGQAGNDSIIGDAGDDSITGGTGADSLLGHSGADTVIGNEGRDTMRGGEGNDSLDGGAQDDSMIGGVGNDTLVGGAGGDLFTTGGVVSSDGVADLDVIADYDPVEGDAIHLRDGVTVTEEKVTDGGVVLTLTGGDQIQFLGVSAPQDIIVALVGGDGRDSIDGTNDNNRMFGFGGNDTLLGLDGDDTLDGGSGNDKLNGGIGTDVFIGGTGSDSFVFSAEAGTDTALDVITDFQDNVDRIDLNAFGFANLDALAPLVEARGPDTLLRLSDVGGEDLLVRGLNIFELSSEDVEISSDENFQSGAEGWSTPTTTDGGGNFSTFLGRFGGGADPISEKTFRIPEGAERVEVSFDFYELDSWEADGGDRFVTYIDGEAVLSEDFDHQLNDPASNGKTGNVSWDIAASTSGDRNLGFSSGTDQIHRVTIEIDDPGESFVLGFGSTLDGGIEDESFGIDNLSVNAIDAQADALLV